MCLDNLDCHRSLCLHAGLQANREICVIFAILEKRQSLFPYYLGSSDHPHTVEVTGSNPVPPKRIESNPLIAANRRQRYTGVMIPIRFTDLDAKKRALGRLAGRFPFKSWATGEMLVPEAALGFLATENVSFQVEGPATRAGFAN